MSTELKLLRIRVEGAALRDLIVETLDCMPRMQLKCYLH